MMLGLAIGDALGNTSEGMNPAERRRHYGEIRDYLPNRYANGRSVGLPSDDTQLAFWTLEHLLENEGRLSPELLSRSFVERQIFGMGQTVGSFRRALASGVPWHDAAVESAGNGALMRIVPILCPTCATAVLSSGSTRQYAVPSRITIVPRSPLASPSRIY
jgi:ADP-ribosyl-[dinitrogen reductase] hydrolase